MAEQLPCYLEGNEHPYLIKLVSAYKPHSRVPSRQELLMNRYELSNHCSIRGLADDIGVDYDEKVKK